MQPTRQRGHDLFVVQRVGRSDDDRVEFLVEKLVGSLEAGHAPGGGDELAGGRRRIGDADDLEQVAERDQVRDVLDLRNGAGADDADA